jgi:pimeloyl-ACP methyl ester carboxylesterase
LKLNYSIKKDEGPQVVFIHGFLGSRHQWKAVFQLFKNSHSTLSIELPGHGTSEDPTDSYTMNELATEVHNILKNEAFLSAHIIGHSMGGYVAATYNTMFPEQIQSLVLINSTAGPDVSMRIKERDRSILLMKKYKNTFVNMAITNLFNTHEREHHKDLIEAMKNNAIHILENSITQAILAMKNRPGSLKELVKHSRAVLYIYGDKDPIVLSNSVKAEIYKLKASSKLLNCGHMSILTHPQLIASTIEEWMINPV